MIEPGGYLRGKLSCVNPKSKKEWVTGEALFGELKEGVVIDVQINFCRSLLAP